MHRMVVLLVLGCLALAGCSKDLPRSTATEVRGGSALDRIRAAKQIRIGIRADSAPFGFTGKDGQPQGFDVDLGMRLARSLGVNPIFVTVTGPERVERLKKGDVDCVIATLTATRRRAHEIDFSLPYYQDQQGLLVKRDSTLQSYRELAGKKIAAMLNSTSIDNIKVVSPDATIVPVTSMLEGVKQLEAGAVDALTGDSLQLHSLKLAAADATAFRLSGEGFSVEPYCVGLPQNDSKFRNAVDEFLTKLWNDGAWTRLFNKWLGPETPYNLEAHFQMSILPP